jgi:galactokinase
MSLPKRATQEFTHRFGRRPTFVVRAPGRVNLIGEHTDYNDGFVLPMAIDRAVWIALGERADRRVTLHSLDFPQAADFDLSDLSPTHEGWAEYVKGVAWALQRAGYALQGFQGVVGGDVPVGAGLSSSAALEMAAARAFSAVSGWAWDATAMAQVGQRAENEWVGVNCGIMDQMISAGGKADHALLIDCRSLETQLAPLPPETTVVVLDTATRRGLVDSAYNERVAQCQAAASFFGLPALRDVTLEHFESRADELDEITRRRARHVITENARTLEAAQAMRRGDAKTLGRLVNASHESLRDDYQVSSDELDRMVELARGQMGCYGARMTGAGFGGCVVALIRSEVIESFSAKVAEAYAEATGLSAKVYVCSAADGAEIAYHVRDG